MRVRIASAGTGKTTSLVLRYLELIDAGVPLGRVAGVTYTRAAAGELRQRVAAAVEEVLFTGRHLGDAFVATPGSRPLFERARNELGGAILSTIHGFMIAGLRLSAPALGLDPSFGLLGEWEAAAIFEEETLSLLMLAAEDAHPLKPHADRLGAAALPLLLQLFARRSLAAELVFGATDAEVALGALYRAALTSYDARLGAAQLSPGEVERRALVMLSRAAARERLVRRFPRVLVDEYQDVNPLQGEFFEQLAAAGAQLELVGDPKQSIYGFRNADVTVFRRAVEGARRTGGVVAPLVKSRRHTLAVAAFLNRLTHHLGEHDLGFSAGEAPPVEPTGPRAELRGSVELAVVEGNEPLETLRGREAEVLAELLAAHHARGVPYEEMAVLARSHAALGRVLTALHAKGVPGYIAQGRGYYERSEIRDVKHALAVGIDPDGESLLPFLRGPFAGLSLPELEGIARAAPHERPELIRTLFPEVAARIERLAQLARATPLEAVKGILREPLGQHRFQEMLRRSGRQNVDALLFEVAGQAPRDVALFLQRLDLLARQAEAGDVPQGGRGVRLLSIHASKGLEFPVTAIFDAGAWGSRPTTPLIVEPRSGAVRLAGSPGFDEAQAAAWERGDQESYRLLYVAASRARDALLITASRRLAGSGGPWYRALDALGLEGARAPEGVRLTRIAYSPPAPVPSEEARSEGELEPAPWLHRRYPRAPLPPVMSPSMLARLRENGALPDREGARPTPGVAQEDGAANEPLDPALRYAAETELELGQAGRGRALGTLTHLAIGQDWRPEDERTRRTLAAQEVLVPFDPAQRAALVAEVLELLGNYRSLLGDGLPALNERDPDRAELPLALRYGSTVWEGIVDRLYRVADDWFLDDYKTDRTVRPERYHLQLGHYLQATEAALGVQPRARLVFLRHGAVIEPPRQRLDDALLAAGIQPLGRNR